MIEQIEKTPITDDQRQAIRDSAHRLRSRLTFILLCSHALKLDLHDVLSLKHENEFHKMDRVLEEIRTVLNALLNQFEQSPNESAIPPGDEAERIGACTDSQDAA